MRHKVAGKSFGRTANQRKALFRGLVTSLFDHLKIETTAAKAKETKRIAEKIITLGKKGDIHSRRLALSRIPNKQVVTKLFTEIAPNIERNSGYLRVVKSRFRAGDNSDMAILEFVDYVKLKEARDGTKVEQKEVKKAKTSDKPQKKEKKAKAAKKEEMKEEKIEEAKEEAAEEDK